MIYEVYKFEEMSQEFAAIFLSFGLKNTKQTATYFRKSLFFQNTLLARNPGSQAR